MRMPFSSSLIFFFIIVLFVQETCSVRHQKVYDFETKLHKKIVSTNVVTSSSLSTASAPLSSRETPFPVSSSSNPKSIGGVFYPMGYGADPSGAEDSSDAILKAVNDALQVKNGGLQLMPGVTDLGGVVIDLQGMSLKINKPIRLPPHAGNIVIQGGSIRASETFPTDRHLVELWSPNSQKLNTLDTTHDLFNDNKAQSSGIYYEAITFRDILFDSSFRGGGIFVIDSARIRIVDCFFLHFVTQGILVQKGHETFISTCFLGEHPTVGGDKNERNFLGTAIDIASNDNAVTDVAIFSAAIGIALRGQANIVTGVHCYNKATYFGGVGILVKAGKTRIDNSYLDYNSIIIEDPSQVHVTNGFFLGGGNVVLRAVRGKISGLTVVNNMFSGNAKDGVPTVSLDGKFTEIDQVVIDHNNVNGMRMKSTVGRMVVPGNGTRWEADFSSVLVFPDQINHVHYSFYVKGGGVFPGHALTKVSDNVVVVESEKDVQGVVSVVVDQYNMAGEESMFM